MIYKKDRFNPIDVLTVSLAHMLHDIYSSFLPPLLPLLVDKLGLTYAMASLLSVVQRAPSLANPLIGLLADKHRTKLFIILTPSITAIAMSLLGVASSYHVLLALLLITGISSTVFHVQGPVVIKTLSGNRIGKGMSFYMVGGEFARTLAPLIILGAVSIWTLEGTWKLIPFGLGLSVFLYFKLRDISLPETTHNVNGKSRAGDTLKKVTPFFLKISGYALSRAMMKSALTTFLPLFIISKGKSVWLGGLSLAVLQFAGVAGTIYAGSISDKIGRTRTLLIISVISPILMWLFMFSNGVYALILLILMGLFLFASSPVLLALVHDLDTDRPAFINSIFMTVNFGLSSLTVIILGILSDYMGLDLTYKISASLAFLSIPFSLFLEKNTLKKMS